jgi:ABC-type Fe3+-hydroxamate transport system substrate-binding protein
MFQRTAVSLLLVASTLKGALAIDANLQGCVPEGEFVLGTDYFPDKFIARDYNGPADYFPGKYQLDNSTDLLEITYHNSYKIVKNKFQGTSYLLYQCGTDPPEEELDGRHNLVLPVPHQGGIAITQTPQIPPIELLGKRREMIAYIGNPGYISSPCLMYMKDEEKTFEVYFDADDPYNRTRELELKNQFLSKHPDAIILEGPYGDKEDDRALAIAASQERTNVATFDWIGLYGALFNLEGEANRIASETMERYQCSASRAAALSADIPEENKVKILWANYFNGYNWSVAECSTWDETYYCEYAAHCGADIISRPEDVGYAPESLGGNYWYVNDDELLELGKDADVWVYPSRTWDTVYQDKKELLDQFKAVQNKQVYDTQGQGPFGWHEQRLGEYDVVALDFCDLAGNENPTGTIHVQKWFRNIFNDPIGSPGVCNGPSDVDQPYVPQGAYCEPLQATNTGGTEDDDEGSKAIMTAALSLQAITFVLASYLLN